MYRIIYLSSATTKFTKEDINQLLEKSRDNNQKNEITGLLLYSDGNILQIIEGKQKALKKLYSKIIMDPRHKHIIKVFEGKVTNRIYPNWKMAFNGVQKETIETKEIVTYQDDFSTITNKDDLIATTFIETFLKSNKDKIIVK
ncbi:BLUF domain-containing protein [Flavobacterium sp. J27]|uniref:BLUF domain-containing protein n=1 Tax=Flavobacterium sp. J27 TaxID=2060419 RepID=UPI00102F437D|nr:BLUF domain-containing protein [Flavobacterium sp. J27]